MSLMPDPMSILTSLQEALDNGMVIDPNELEDGYKFFYDEPFKGGRRFSFARIESNQALAISIFGLEDSIDGVVCYNVGYAVKNESRGQGLAVKAVFAGIEALKILLRREGVNTFFIESVIDLANTPSIRVAEKIFPDRGIKMKEYFTGTPSLYFRVLISIR